MVKKGWMIVKMLLFWDFDEFFEVFFGFLGLCWGVGVGGFWEEVVVFLGFEE